MTKRYIIISEVERPPENNGCLVVLAMLGAGCWAIAQLVCDMV